MVVVRHNNNNALEKVLPDHLTPCLYDQGVHRRLGQRLHILEES